MSLENLLERRFQSSGLYETVENRGSAHLRFIQVNDALLLASHYA